MSSNISLTFLGTTSGGGPTETRNCSSLVLDALGNGSLWSACALPSPPAPPSHSSSWATRQSDADLHPQWSTVQRELCVSLNNSLTVQATPASGWARSPRYSSHTCMVSALVPALCISVRVPLCLSPTPCLNEIISFHYICTHILAHEFVHGPCRVSIV